MAEVIKCDWCGEEYEIYDMVHEQDLGWLCETCVRAIESRGETLIIDDTP